MSDFTIGGVFKRAWSRLRGSKRAIWSIGVLVILIAATVEYFSKWLMITDSQALHYWARYLIIPIIMNLIIGPFYAGSFMVAIKCARQEKIDIRSGYQYFHWSIPTAITMVIIGLLSNLVVIIMNIPAIGQSVGRWLPYFDLIGALFSLAVYSLFILSIPLIIDKNRGIGTALCESFKIIKSHWLRVFFIFFLTYLILFIAYLPTVIGLAINITALTFIGIILFVLVMIWFLPFLFLLGGDIYQKLVDKSTPEAV